MLLPLMFAAMLTSALLSILQRLIKPLALITCNALQPFPCRFPSNRLMVLIPLIMLLSRNCQTLAGLSLLMRLANATAISLVTLATLQWGVVQLPGPCLRCLLVAVYCRLLFGGTDQRTGCYGGTCLLAIT